PMYAVTALKPNTGKSLLTSSALMPGAGEVAPSPYTGNDEEMRKRITSTLLAGRSVAWIDNVPEKMMMDSPVNAAVLTSPTGRWDDRILGHTKMASVPIKNVWVLTGNNPTISAELTRRMVPIMLTHPHSDEYPFALDLDDVWLETHRADLI